MLQEEIYLSDISSVGYNALSFGIDSSESCILEYIPNLNECSILIDSIDIEVFNDVEIALKPVFSRQTQYMALVYNNRLFPLLC